MKFLNYFVFLEVAVKFYKVFFILETDALLERTLEWGKVIIASIIS